MAQAAMQQGSELLQAMQQGSGSAAAALSHLELQVAEQLLAVERRLQEGLARWGAGEGGVVVPVARCLACATGVLTCGV